MKLRPLELRKKGKQWIVTIRCPFCGMKHTFDGGKDVKPFVGEVNLPCNKELALVEV